MVIKCREREGEAEMSLGLNVCLALRSIEEERVYSIAWRNKEVEGTKATFCIFLTALSIGILLTLAEWKAFENPLNTLAYVSQSCSWGLFSGIGSPIVPIANPAPDCF
jgi:hypothetical protein